jgi:hypothetical protein
LNYVFVCSNGSGGSGGVDHFFVFSLYYSAEEHFDFRDGLGFEDCAGSYGDSQLQVNVFIHHSLVLIVHFCDNQIIKY